MMRDKMLAYLETKRPPKTDSALASSIIQHWQTRHLYGKALIISDAPEEIAKLTRKQWVSAMQSIQQQRAKTFDADKLLNLTHAITRMQQMAIAADPPHEFPAAHLWNIDKGQLPNIELPRTCRTIYVSTTLEPSVIEEFTSILPPHTLVVDYADNTWQLTAKQVLDETVHHTWDELGAFLQHHNINVGQLLANRYDIDSIDDALDTLLDNSSAFLRHARHFQEALHLAQPLQLSHLERQKYELAGMLARRVTMLTPGLLHHSFVQNENDTFSLYDNLVTQKHTRESLTAIIARHLAAGRTTLARALETAFVNNKITL